MFSRLTSWFTGDLAEAAYQPVPVEVPLQDNTELFNQIPVDVLAIIASKLSKEDLIPFLLTNTKTFGMFENFRDRGKLGNLLIWMPTSLFSVYKGASVQVNFSDVNHVLMAQYSLNIELEKLEANKNEIESQYKKRKCMVYAAGAGVAIAAHLGGAILLDQVVLPACASSGNGYVNFSCYGNICQSADPVILGQYTKVTGEAVEVVTQSISLSSYRVLNIMGVYLPVPCIASAPIGCLPFCADESSSCNNFIFGKSYSEQYYELRDKIDMVDSTRYVYRDFEDIIRHNKELRNRKIGGATYRMFNAPQPVKMQDEVEKPAIDPVAPVANSNNEPERRIAME